MKRMKDNHRVAISEVFSQMRSRSEVVCTFLAVLEVIKLKHIAIVQEEVFGEIIIERHEEESGL
jgi:segregation and condensation protein A